MAPFLWTQKQDIGPAARAGHAMVNDAVHRQVVLFGGALGSGSPLSADTWTWDGALWTQAADSGPSGRWGHAMAFDVARGVVVLFGGLGNGGWQRDTWTWDGGLWTQVADTGPSDRLGHAMAYDSARGVVVLSGGHPSPAGEVDTWTWDGEEWTQVADTGPSRRAGHAMAAQPGPDGILLYGGIAPDGSGLADTWTWNGSAWANIEDIGPGPRGYAGMVGLGADAILHGGVASLPRNVPMQDRTVFADTWRWHGGRWTEVQDIGPSARFRHTMAFREDTGRIVMFGGTALLEINADAAYRDSLLADTWEHAGAPLSEEIEVASVAFTADAMLGAGHSIPALVTLNRPAPAEGVRLVTHIHFGVGVGGAPLDPPGITFLPVPLTVGAGETTRAFMVRATGPLPAPGPYSLAVVKEGGAVVKSALLTIG